MNRQINHTGRKRIPRDAVKITLREENGRLTFDATRKFSDGLPPDAHVWLEAYRQASWTQFSWGRVSEPSLPTDRWLDEFDGEEGLLFRVRVTAAGESHRILAEADRVPCQASDGKSHSESLLPICVRDLGNEVWRLELDSEEPMLVVNRSVGDGKALARTPEFAALVYPAVVRALFTRILLDEDTIPDDGDEGWRGMWLKFAKQHLGAPDVPETKENRRQWIEDAASTFAQTYALAERFNAGRNQPEDAS